MRLVFFTRLLVLIFTTLYAALPLPSSFEFHELEASDRVKIKAGRFCGKGAIDESADKVMFVLPGRVSRIDRHEFLAQQFAQFGFRVWVLDFRGQGRSQRLVENLQMVHVDDFNEYIHDVEALMNWDRFTGQRKFLYGHSMGGQVALQIMRKHPNTFEAAVLEAPMVRINTAPFPYFFSESIAYFMANWLRQGKQYCLGKGDYDPVKQSFQHNRNCHDKSLFNKHFFIPESDKELVPDGPSWGWLHAAFSVTHNLLNNLAKLRAIRTKVFIATAGDDKVLDTSFDATVASALGGAHYVYPKACHCLLHDSLSTRAAYLADVSDFLKNSNDFIGTHRAVASASAEWTLWLWSLRARMLNLIKYALVLKFIKRVFINSSSQAG